MNQRLSTAVNKGQEIFARLGWPLLVIDNQLHIRSVNPAFRECFEMKDDLVIGLQVFDLGHGCWDIPELRSLLEESLPANGKIRDFEIRHSFGTPIERIMLLDVERTGGDLPLTVITFREVSDFVEITAVKKPNDSLLAEIVEQAPDGVFVVDSDLAMYQVNSNAKPVFADITPLIGRDLSEIMQIHWGPELGEVIVRAFRNTLKTGERYICSDFSAQRADLGVVQSFDWEIQRVRLSGDRPGVVCYFTEMTESNAEKALLITRAEELKRANRNKDEFLAMLAHELRNPLASLFNAAEILEMADATFIERVEAQSIIRRQLDTMHRLVDDLLDIARVTQRKIYLRKTVVPLESILTSAIHLARSVCKDNGQELTVSIRAEGIHVEGDVIRLEQVVGNLLSNASRYSGPGSRISLSVERSAVQPHEAVLRVSDNGFGIEPELLPRVFDAFVQSERTIDRAGGGLGIGLTLVERVVHLHDGRIEAFSAGPNQGTEFVVHLPIMMSEQSGLSEVVAGDRTGEVGRRILIIDDNADSARTLAVIQGRKGHETRMAFEGKTAIEIVAEFLPEIVLIDIGLPGMDGFEVARQIRKFSEMRSALLIAMSGYDGEGFLRQSRDSGFDEYMVKPLDLKRLNDLIASRQSDDGHLADVRKAPSCSSTFQD